jgi:putative inorganic carbon (hco3(-)) transporter
MPIPLHRANFPWLAAAMLLGLAAALFPLPTLLLIGVVGLLVVFYIEPLLALCFMLTVAPLKTLLETEASIILPIDIGQIALALFVGIWAVRYLVEKKSPLYLSRHLLAGIGFFILAAVLSLWIAQTPSIVLTELLKWIQLWLLVLILSQTDRWQWILPILIFSGVLQALLGLWQFRGGSGAAHLWILDYRFFRAFGTFGQPNPFGAFMGMILPLALGTTLGFAAYAYWQKNNVAWLWGGFYLGCTALLFGGLLASWSRGAWLGFLAACAVMAWSLPRQRWQGSLLIGTGLLLGAVLWATGLLPAGVSQRLTGFGQDFVGFRDVRGVIITDDNYAVIERLAHWQAAIEMAKTHPWLGVGFGNYESAYPAYALINWPRALGHAHNYYLNLLAETGIIGLSAYLLMWSTIIVVSWRLISTPILDWRQRGVVVGLMGTWTHILVHSFLDKLYVNNLFLHIGSLIGLLAVLSRQRLYDNTHQSR